MLGAKKHRAAWLVLAVLAASCNTASAWKGGYSTPDLLGQAVVDALNNKDKEALGRLLVSEEEFRELLWPRFPASNPDWNVPVEVAWDMHAGSARKGLVRAIRDWGGQDLTFERIGWQAEVQDYEDFRLRRGTVIQARRPDGTTAKLKIAGSVVDVDGSYRLLSYRD